MGEYFKNFKRGSLADWLLSLMYLEVKEEETLIFKVISHTVMQKASWEFKIIFAEGSEGMFIQSSFSALVQ